MHNCFRVFHNGRIFAVVGTQARADFIIRTLSETCGDDWMVVPAFIEGAGF